MEPARPDQGAAGGSDSLPAAEEQSGEVLEALEAVIAEIEGAPAGNPQLDARINFGFRVVAGQSPDIAALLIGEGISWPTVQAALDETIPAFSTSLDAALNGERITFVLHSARRDRWGAMQKAASGAEIMGWAATEALARRLAALKSWRADLIAAMEDDNPSDVPRYDRRRQAPAERKAVDLKMVESEATADEGVSEEKSAQEKDWEVLF